MREAGKLSMLIDVSHLSDEGVEDVLNFTSCPPSQPPTNAPERRGQQPEL